MAVNPEFLKGSLSLMVLHLVTSGETYGYQLIKDLDARSDGLFTLKEGSLYPVLHALERDGLITARWGVSEVGRRRKYYKATTSGRRELASRTEDWDTFARAIAAVLETGDKP